MHLSLSYDEYDKWAGRLAKIAPDSKMLSEHMESTHDLRDRGHAWSGVMHLYASTYYDPEPSLNQGLYASAAATLQLMLKNRETLRFSRSDWGFATRAYAEVVGLAAAKCYENQKRTGADVNTQEFLFIVQGAIPLVEQYVNANPSDAEAKDRLRELEDLMKSPSSGTETAISQSACWQTSNGLEQAIANSGLDGLRFELNAINIEEDYVAGDVLLLTFRSLDPVPQGKEHAAGLALRCIVGLTLPLLNTQASGLRLEALPNSYTVGLGKGVQILPTLIMRGKNVAIPVKTSSRESGNNWYVDIRTLFVPVGGSAQHSAVQRQLLEDLCRRLKY